jgi:hypothetical protein
VDNSNKADSRTSNGKQESSERSKSWEVLGDFTTTPRLLPISGLALAIGVVAAFVALALLRLIGLFTNLFYFGRWNTAMVSPVGNHLGIFSVLVPVGGALIIGLMAQLCPSPVPQSFSRFRAPQFPFAPSRFSVCFSYRGSL